MPILPKTTVSEDGRTIILRHITEDDAAPILQLLNEVCAEEAFMLRSKFDITVEEEQDFIRSIRSPNVFLVAECEGILVGWLGLFQSRAEFCQYVADLGMGVKREFRGIGIGAGLIEAALEWAREVGLEKITLGVRASNTVALKLYRAFGFICEGHRLRQVKHKGQYDDDYLMAYFVRREA